jgi:hypothetical protein
MSRHGCRHAPASGRVYGIVEAQKPGEMLRGYTLTRMSEASFMPNREGVRMSELKGMPGSTT